MAAAVPPQSEADLLKRAKSASHRLRAALRRDASTVKDATAVPLIQRMDAALERLETQLEKGIA